MSNWKKYLEKIYFDPSHPASFQSPLRLYHTVQKEEKFKISHAQIKKWIQSQESYSRNKAVNRKFQRGKVVVAGIDDQFDADLASFISYADENDGYKYLLAVIDILVDMVRLSLLKIKLLFKLYLHLTKYLKKVEILDVYDQMQVKNLQIRLFRIS